MSTAAASSSTADAPPPHLVPFARSVLSLLSVWPALQLAFHHSPPKQQQAEDSLLKEFAAELVGAFLDASSSAPTDGLSALPATAEPSSEELEDFLLGWVFATLEVRIEDDSEVTVARDLSRIWKEWVAAGGEESQLRSEDQGGMVARIEGMARRKREKGALMGGRRYEGQARVVGEDGQSDSDSDDEEDEGEVDGMEVDVPQPPEVRRRPEPEVDEDGFTTVRRGART